MYPEANIDETTSHRVDPTTYTTAQDANPHDVSNRKARAERTGRTTFGLLRIRRSAGCWWIGRTGIAEASAFANVTVPALGSRHDSEHRRRGSRRRSDLTEPEGRLTDGTAAR